MSDVTEVAASAEGALARSRALATALVALTKPKQTALLLVTAAGAYALSAPAGPPHLWLVLGMAALAAAVSGCTALNMVADRDIDAKMGRTEGRPLPAGEVGTRTAAAWGMALSLGGLVLALAGGPLFAAVVASGLVIDLGVYTLWLKRRTPLSIVLGGVAGGMPALAGRVLAIGRIDAVGVLLALAVLLWIPAHILTLAIRHEEDYRRAGVPMWPVVHGAMATRKVVAVSTVGAAIVLAAAGALLRLPLAAQAALDLLGVGLAGLAVWTLARPSLDHDHVLFKAASLYMAAAFGCLVVGSVLG